MSSIKRDVKKKSSASTGVEILYGINFTHRPGVAGF